MRRGVIAATAGVVVIVAGLVAVGMRSADGQLPRVPDPPATATAPDTAGLVARLRDPAIPLPEREARIDGMDRPGDLIAIADAGTHLSPRAIRRLGALPWPEVRAYLERRVADHGSLRVAELAAAAISLGEVAGEDAVPHLAELLAAARRRTDGLGDGIITACIDALVMIGGDVAAAALAADLAGLDRDPAAGAAVVRALDRIDRPAAIAPLIVHADALAAALPAEIERMRHMPGGASDIARERLRGHHLSLINHARQTADSLHRRHGSNR